MCRSVAGTGVHIFFLISKSSAQVNRDKFDSTQNRSVAGRRSATQIGFFYFSAVTQLFSRTGQGDISGFDNIGLMGQR